MSNVKKKSPQKKPAAARRPTKSAKKTPLKKIAPAVAPMKRTKTEGWVALELTPRGESEKNVQGLVDLIRKNLGDDSVEIFVPIYYQNEEFFERNISLFGGYYFIQFLPGIAYHKLRDSKYFEGVVCDPTSKEVQIIPNQQVDQLKDKFTGILREASNLKPGMTVEILDGLYKNLTAKVIRVIKKEKTCILKLTSLKSRNITVSAPFMSLRPVNDGDCDSDVPTFF